MAAMESVTAGLWKVPTPLEMAKVSVVVDLALSA